MRVPDNFLEWIRLAYALSLCGPVIAIVIWSEVGDRRGLPGSTLSDVMRRIVILVFFGYMALAIWGGGLDRSFREAASGLALGASIVATVAWFLFQLHRRRGVPATTP